jgi:hypothetical protein
MNVGLPGVGVSGLFYFFCALFMPLREIYLYLKNPSHCFRYRVIFTQLGLVGGMSLGLFMVYRLLDTLFAIGVEQSTQILSLSLWPFLGLFLLLGLLILLSVIAHLFFNHPTEK